MFGAGTSPPFEKCFPIMTFPSAHPALGRALAERGYLAPTPVQLAVLGGDAGGRDLLVSAQTGSGKTVAFGLAIAPTLLGDAERLPEAAAPMALVIAPTRELALQVQRELAWLYADTGARVVTCVGGMDARAEARQLGYGAHIVVGTPGRLRDHLERQRLDLSKLGAVVLDEADEMLDLGFREDLEFILDATPEGRQTLLFSATMPRAIEALARRYQRDAVRIETLRRDEQHADIEYRAIRVAPGDIENAVVNVLRLHEARATIVFCATRASVNRLHGRLAERGFSAVAISGELTQNERSHALQALRDGRARVLVATDVAARGLDLPDLALVIHADLPNDAETLLHRSGRTGRAGNKGMSTLIVPFNRRRKADALLATAKLKVVWEAAPKPQDIRARDQERFLAEPIFTDAASEEETSAVRALQEHRTAEEIALALVRAHFARLPAPEELQEDPGPPRRDDRARPSRERFERPAFGARERDDRHRDGASPTFREPRAPRAPRDPNRPMVWFRVDIGRERNADPRWLLPLICKAGNVTRSEIGSIKIFDRDSRFEVAQDVADSFEDAARGLKPNEGRISRLGASAPTDAPRADRAAGPRPPRRDRDHKERDAGRERETRARPSSPSGARGEPWPKKAWHDRGQDRTRERSEGKAGEPRDRKSDGPKRPFKAGKPFAAGPKPKGGQKPVSKYAHKKKHRPAPQN